MLRGLIVLGSNAALMFTMVAQPAASAIFKNTFNPQAALSADRQQLVVSGPVHCAEADTVTIRVVVTQPATDVVATGERETACTGAEQEWSVTATVQGNVLAEEGPAKACAVAVTRDDLGVTDTRQWCARSGLTLQLIQ
jgi:hypothetical protein